MRYTINLEQEFAKARMFAAMHQFQGWANQLIEIYDYNDVMKSVEFAKSKHLNKLNANPEETIILIENLFIEARDWLKANAKELKNEIHKDRQRENRQYEDWQECDSSRT